MSASAAVSADLGGRLSRPLRELDPLWEICAEDLRAPRRHGSLVRGLWLATKQAAAVLVPVLLFPLASHRMPEPPPTPPSQRAAGGAQQLPASPPVAAGSLAFAGLEASPLLWIEAAFANAARPDAPSDRWVLHPAHRRSNPRPLGFEPDTSWFPEPVTEESIEPPPHVEPLDARQRLIETLSLESEPFDRAARSRGPFASWVRHGSLWPWDLLLEDADGTVWNVVTGCRGRRGVRSFHNAIDVGAPRGTPIRFVGFVPWEVATVARVVPHEEACAPYSPRNICNAGSILELESRIGGLRVTRKIYHSELGAHVGQQLRPGNLVGWVWDHGRTRSRNGRRGSAPHVHYEAWVSRLDGSADAPGSNMPLSRLRREILSEVSRLEAIASSSSVSDGRG